MSEEQTTARGGFFSRMFAGPTEGEGTSVYAPEEVGRETVEDSSRGFTVERAAEVIKNLPPEVPRPAAVRIVRGTLEAAGINVSDLATSTRAREARLNSEIELSQGRIKQLVESTEAEIRSLEEQIRNAREARDFGVSEQETKISGARSGLEDVTMVRDFFELPPDGEAVEEDAAPAGPDAGEQTQVMQPADEDDTQILRRPGPLSEGYRDGEEPR